MRTVTRALHFFQAGTLRQGKVSQQRQRGHVRDGEGRSAELTLTLNTSQCTKKKGKASVKVSTSLKAKTCFTWKAEVSYCAIQITGRPDQNGFKALSSNAEPSCQVKTRFTWEPQTVTVQIDSGRPDQPTVSTRSAPYTLHVGAANSYCATDSLAVTNHSFNAQTSTQ